MTNQPMFAAVAIPKPLRHYFHYRLPEGSKPRIGARVRVPFGKRELSGVIAGLEANPDIAEEKIRELLEILPADGDLPEVILKLCNWAADYYQHPVGEVIAAAMPSLLRKGKWQADKLPDAGPFSLQRTHYQDIEVTPEQKSVLDRITQAGSEKPFLLHGITGSGKTEIYLRVTESILQQGGQVLVLVPEIGLTSQTINRFQNRFDLPISIMHSGLTDKERAIGWLQAKEGQTGIILGTRSAVFTPMKSPGLIIVDEEHDASYKQHDGFRYSARDLAVLRGQMEQVPVILGSATPSLESLHNALTGKYELLKLVKRPPGVQTESYELLDTRYLATTGGFTHTLKSRIETRLAKGEQVLVFINRRGFAPVMMCKDCNWIAQCSHCDARLTYHLSTDTLVCHHCGRLNRNLVSCQSCGGNQLSTIGAGTQRVEQTLNNLFPQVPVYRIDRDSTRKKGAMKSLLNEVHKEGPAILVGTQLLAKGHHFPNVTLVAILDVDSGFYSADFRAVEKLGQMILQVGGRAGRANKPGLVILQTAFASHPLLQQLVSAGYSDFAKTLLDERQEAELPPCTFQALVRAEASQSSTAREFLELIAKAAPVHKSVDLLGPIPALMEKRAGRYRQLLIVAANQRALIHQSLSEIIAIAESLPEARKVRWSVDVDPVDA